MLEPVISGILLGCVVALLVGPVFFLILNTSLHRGFTHGAQVAFGVMLSDALFIFIAYFGSNFILLLDKHKSVAGIVASVLLLSFGIGILIKKYTVPLESIQLNEKMKSPIVFIAKGFMLNAMNPSVLFFWIGVAGTVGAKEHYTIKHLLVFYPTILCTVFSTDLLKAYIAHKIKSVLTENLLTLINRISGVVLIGFAVYTFIKSV
jgi:threonine/homoserine/homoserine lactone efflux protein